MRTGKRVLWGLGMAAATLGLAGRPAEGRAQERQTAQASEAEYEGWRQYMVHCARCHGDDAVAGVMAPDLRGSISKGKVTEATFRSVVTEGLQGKGMPGFQKQLTGEQIGAIYAYVAARAKGGLPAGRPKT